MTIASIVDTPYRLAFLAHIVSVLIALAPAVVHPLAATALGRRGDGSLEAFLQVSVPLGRRVYGSALIATGFFGILMILFSEEVWEFSQAWVSGAFVLWFAMIGVQHGLLLPAEKRWADGDASAQRQVMLGGQILTFLALVMLYVMIWKPGL